MSMFNRAKEAAQGVNERLDDSGYKDVVKDKINENIPPAIKEKIEAMQKELNETKAKMRVMAEQQAAEIRERVNRKIEEKLYVAMDYAGDKIKANAKDPYMPNSVKKAVDKGIDIVWADVAEEVVGAVTGKLRPKAPVDHGDPPSCCPTLGLKKLRAFVLYTVMPYDRSFWQQIRNPAWWVFTLISLIPEWGVSQAVYFLLLLITDWHDEYQLCAFILGFKGLLFFTAGFLPVIIGSLQYYFCVFNASNSLKTNCDEAGPQDEYWEVIFFLIQIVMVWGAFLLLPYSHKKGATKYLAVTSNDAGDANGDGVMDADEAQKRHYAQRGVDLDEEDNGCCGCGCGKTCCGAVRHARRGGRLGVMVYYDVIMFTIAIIFIALAAVFGRTSVIDSEAGELETNWRLKMTLYWCRVFYGLSSLPFLAFKIPFLSLILTHAKPTGYNRNGVTVPCIPPAPPPPPANQVSPADMEAGQAGGGDSDGDGGEGGAVTKTSSTRRKSKKTAA